MSLGNEFLSGILGAKLIFISVGGDTGSSASRCVLPVLNKLSKEREETLYWSLVESTRRVMEEVFAKPDLEERFKKEYFALDKISLLLRKQKPENFLRSDCFEQLGLVFAGIHGVMKTRKRKLRPGKLMRAIKAGEKAVAEARPHRLDVVRAEIAGIEIEGLRTDVSALTKKIEQYAIEVCRKAQVELGQAREFVKHNIDGKDVLVPDGDLHRSIKLVTEEEQSAQQPDSIEGIEIMLGAGRSRRQAQPSTNGHAAHAHA